MACAARAKSWAASFQSKNKSVLNLSAQDAPAALPQNCQTLEGIVGESRSAVNITEVIHLEFLKC